MRPQKCPNTRHPDFRRAVEQTSLPLTMDTYSTKQDYPATILEEELKSIIGLTDNKQSTIVEAAKELRLYNELNNNSHSIKVGPDGTPILKMNYLSIPAETARQALSSSREDQLDYDFSKEVFGIHEKVDEKRLEFYRDIVGNIHRFIDVRPGTEGNSARTLGNSPMKILIPKGGKDNKNGNLDTIQQTYSWANKVKTHFNSFYKSKFFGELVTVEEDFDIRGSIIKINIPKKLVDNLMENYSDMTPEARTDSQEYYDSLNLKDKINNKSESDIKKEVNEKLQSSAYNFMVKELLGKGVKLYSNDDIEALFGKEATHLYSVFENNKIYINKDKMTFDTPLHFIMGNLLLNKLRVSDSSVYSKALALLQSNPKLQAFSEKFRLYKDSLAHTIFSTYFSLDYQDQLTKTDKEYWTELKKLIPSESIEDPKSNYSFKNILLSLQNNKEFMDKINASLDITQEELFNKIDNSELKKRLNDLNYIQKICTI